MGVSGATVSPIDEAALTAAFEKLSTAEAAGATELAGLVKTAGAVACDASGVLAKIEAASKDKKSVTARQGAALGFKELVGALGKAGEPVLAKSLDVVVALCGDKAKEVRAASDEALDAFIALCSGFGIKSCMHAITAGFASSQWQAKVAACKLLDSFTKAAPRQTAACLPDIIPPLSEAMTDMKKEVVKAATKSLEKVCATIGNKDIEPFIPTLIVCITKIDEVPDCVHALAATTFVQEVEQPALSMMAPLLIRGLDRSQKTAIRRKSAVIIDNMCKLVEDPEDAAPFVPKLLPALQRLVDEIADPECRNVAKRAHSTLLQAAGEASSAVVSDDSAPKITTPEICLAHLKEAIAGVAGCSTADVEKAPNAGVYLDYAAHAACTAILSKNFEAADWAEKCMVPYLSCIMSEADAKATSDKYVASAEETHKAKKVTFVDDEEGETLCTCEFSLAYGALILLNNASLHLKKGKRYGLCGPNGCGKSTLMKAIANGQVEGFPPPEEVRTVYVEHDIDGATAEMSVVDFVCSNEVLKADGVTVDEAHAVFETLGFTEAMRNGPIVALSGGWKMKCALGRAILMKADIFLLDEPTNHLDTTNVAWLEEYLKSQDRITSLIVSHDSGFLDSVCTHIIHYETRKLKTYRGNLSAFVKQCPAAKSYYELANDNLKFIFPAPGYLEGVKNKDKAIVKCINVTFKYPGTERMIIANPTSVQVSLSSRVACLGPNGAGKSTLIKMMTGETEPTTGSVWKHQNMRYAYIAQHAFHHVEQHVHKTPNEYIQWRYSGGEDKENLEKVTAQLTEAEEKKIKERIEVEFTNADGDKYKSKVVFEKFVGRRQKKNTYEYEVKFENMSMDATAWMEREKLEKLGFEKLLIRFDEKESARMGLYARPLTKANVEKHLIDFGLDAEFGTHNRILGLSGGQKVKLVLAAGMWNQPHVLVLDEPTNYLDRDALGALSIAIKEYGGGVVCITHSKEFSDSMAEEVWAVANGEVSITGNKWGKGGTGGSKEKVDWDGPQEDVIDALGNTVKVKGPKKKLSRKDIKARAKMRKAKLERGEDLSTDSDWDLDVFIGEEAGKKEKKPKA